MDRDDWIECCAASFHSTGELHESDARDYAITEFLIRCHEEPVEDSPVLPVDRWPDPRTAAADAMRESIDD